MPDFEDLRMIDLVNTFKADIISIQEKRTASQFKRAGKNLQAVYNFHLTSTKSFSGVEDYLKNLYTSFNYAAVIINDALKRKKLERKNAEILDECIEVMSKCCDIITAKLTKKKKK